MLTKSQTVYFGITPNAPESGTTTDNENGINASSHRSAAALFTSEAQRFIGHSIYNPASSILC
jgi:hypothetical protein